MESTSLWQFHHDMICSSTSPKVDLVRHQLDENGQIAYQLDRVDDRFIVRYADDLKFNVAPHLPEDHPDLVRIHCRSNVCESLKVHYYSNQILPMIKAWKGATVLHSSSVHVESGCVGLFGRSGAGKSTLANMLCSKPGFSFWSDDWLEILLINETCHSKYSPSQTRLYADHTEALKESGHMNPDLQPIQENEKLIFPSPSTAVEQLPTVSGLYELIPSKSNVSIHCERLTFAKAFQAISLNIFRLDTQNQDHMKREYFQVIRILETIPVFRFYYPHHINQMEASLQFLESHIKQALHHS